MADKLTLDRQDMKNRATAHLRIYVGNLNDQATVEELYDHFIPYGQINGIVINRNFGFVQFETEKSAQDAISKADGSVLGGKQLSVRTAQTNVDKQRRETEVVNVQPDKPPAVALTDNVVVINDDAEDPYDNYGNYIGDNREEEEAYAARNDNQRGGPRGRAARGAPRGRGQRGGRGGQAGFRERSPIPGGRAPEKRQRGPRTRKRPRRGPRQDGMQSQDGQESNDSDVEFVEDGADVGNLEVETDQWSYRDQPVRPFNSGSRRGEWADRGFDRYPQSVPDYPRALPVTERNDCEIIVVSKALTEYAEYIEGRLKRLGIVVDLLFPMEDVPIGKVLGNIASRGCLYAILVMPQNQEHRSLTLTILHGLPQEHRNMPLDDALQLLSRNFQEVQRGGPSGREAVYALLGQLADGRTLTVLQYDKVIEYLQERREQQVKIELGEPLTTPAVGKKEVDLQQRILSILNEKKVIAPAVEPPPTPAASAPNKLLNDPTVRKALDSIMQKLL